MVEGTTVSVSDKSTKKAIKVDTANILFVASGAFRGLEKIVGKRSAEQVNYAACVCEILFLFVRVDWSKCNVLRFGVGVCM